MFFYLLLIFFRSCFSLSGASSHKTSRRAAHFYYVYILRDVATGIHHYTGVTHDLQERLAMYNAGHVPHASKFVPWYIETAIAFRDKEKAFAYERHLKSGAGRAYAVSHF